MNFLESVMAPQLERARERRIAGIVAAKVASIDEDGAYRLEYLSMGDGAPSAPARVMTPMAGSGRGMHFLPEPGDEVVVAFEDGDPALPVILGAVWNNESAVPSQADPSPTNNTRTVVSRSGHELTFDDTAAAEKVTLKSRGGHVIEFDDAPGRGKVTIRSGLGHVVEMDDTPPGKVTLRSSAGVSLTLDNAGGTATLEALTTLTLRGLMINLEAAGGIVLRTTNVPTGSLVNIDGSMYGVHVHMLGPNVTTGPLLI
jgi:phage baseplate assembly protein gpV